MAGSWRRDGTSATTRVSAPCAGATCPGAVARPGETAGHDVTELEHVVVHQAVIDEQPVLPPGDEAERVQQLKVLGQVRLVQPGALAEVANGEFSVPEGVEDPQPRRFGERLETGRYPVEQLVRQSHRCSSCIQLVRAGSRGGSCATGWPALRHSLKPPGRLVTSRK